ncbi:MAG TPA: dTDP-4-dehydrorhamnose reductase [Candidatus Baltobacteraceae bacterium]|nr:dTDP-4-dehydrorhamnose reductase [Candidatus Baltobacteraceae bacterium]
MRSRAERVLVIGGSGQLGSALVEAFAGREVLAPSHRELSLENDAPVRAYVGERRPDVVVNCAAFHDVAACEREPDRAFAINAVAVDRLAAACAEAGAAFVSVSTDYVFDGTARRPYREHDVPAPLNLYGVSKVAGELLAARHGGRWMVVRTSGLYGPAGVSAKGPVLIERLRAQAARGEPVRVVDDVVFSPSYAPHVAAVIRELVDAGGEGIVHVAGSGACSWHEFASYAFARLGLGPVEPVRAAASAVRRPAFSALESARLAGVGVAPPPPWREGVDAYLARRAELAASAS